ncbi:hypothetical protein [Natrialba sp. SSL1]|uniref:hypothetical protein n=1 Tax=Natrialba sp. SSL1 TaxID=1869245 RepID=UPI0008F873AE|nr:hypothetical protein [Natrialba sp. SSL1]OIB56595.1 hypothetical protein BBD46_16535 [Natrialba sp. SSL1]
MYDRESNAGQKVEWNPSDGDIALQAMHLTPETGVPEHFELPEDANVPVETDVARRVRECYHWLGYINVHSDDNLEEYDDRDAVKDRYEELKAKNEDGE